MIAFAPGVGAENLAGSVRTVTPASSVPGPVVDEKKLAGLPAEVATRHTAFARMAGSKDEAVHIAQTVREVAGVLDRARELVETMRAQVQILVKNYPPFPPGSEQRLQYLNSISSLRQQLEAMIIPPLESDVEPVLYPLEARLPEFDAERASDEQLIVFGHSLDALGQRITVGLTQLHVLVNELSEWAQMGLPQSPASDAQADTLSRETATQLPRYDLSLLGRWDGLLQIDREYETDL